MSHVEDTLTRILAIDFKSFIDAPHKRRWSHIALFKEYMRRTAIWGQEFGWTPSYNALILLDQAEKIQPGISLPADISARLDTLRPLDRWQARYFPYALKWAVLEDTDSTGRFARLNPYEPLIILYERGGYISSEHGFIDISMVGIPTFNLTLSKIVNFVPLGMSAEALDDYDEKQEAEFLARQNKA